MSGIVVSYKYHLKFTLKRMSNDPVVIQYFGLNIDKIDFLYAINEKGVIIVGTSLKRIIIWKPDFNSKFVAIHSNELPERATSMEFQQFSENIKLYAGQFDGKIAIITMNNNMDHILGFKFIQAHEPNCRINCIKLFASIKALFTVGLDKTLSWFDINTEEILYSFKTSCFNNLTIQINEINFIIFTTNIENIIQCFEIFPNNSIKIKPLTPILHDKSKIISYTLFTEKFMLLLVGALSGEIFVYGKNHKPGENLVLLGHESQITFLKISANNFLISISQDGTLILWNLFKARSPVQVWKMRDECSLCSLPFLWNIKKMFSLNKIGSRRHHCRICGESFCEEHCCKRSVSPLHGIEIASRLCEKCYSCCNSKQIESLCIKYKLFPNPDLVVMDTANYQLFISPRKTPVQHLDLRKTLLDEHLKYI